MKNLFRFAVFILGLAAFFQTAPRAQAQLYTFINVTNGPYGVAGASGTWTFTGGTASIEIFPGVYDNTQIPNASGTFVTGANGAVVAEYPGYEVLGTTYIVGTFSATVTSMPDSLVLGNNTISFALDGTGGIDLGPFTYYVASGPLNGYVDEVENLVGVNGITVTGSVSGAVTTSSTGYFSLGSGPAQTVNPSAPNTPGGSVFAPAPVTIYPGNPVNFLIFEGYISGTIGGAGGLGATLTFQNQTTFSACQTQSSLTTGAYSSCFITYPYNAGDLFTVTPSKFGYVFNPKSVGGMPIGEEGVNFTSSTTPPKIGRNSYAFSFPENTGTISLPVYTNVQFGTVPSNDVVFTVSSSSPKLVPNTTPSLYLTGPAGGQTNVLNVVPGAVGSTTIQTIVNDTVSPPATYNVTINVTNVLQAPVAGMPVALFFNGNNNYVRAPNFAANAPTTEVTVEFWATNLGIYDASALFLAQDDTANRFNIHPDWPGGAYGTIYWDFGNISGGGRLSYALPQAITGQWHHFAFVSTQTNTAVFPGGGGGMEIYIDGILVASKPGGGTFTDYGDDLLIGAGATAPVAPSDSYFTGFHGGLSDLRIWNTALTASNILHTMNNPLVGNEPGLVLYYRFNEDSGVTIHDSSPTGLKGFIQGDAPYPSWIAAQTNFGNYVIQKYTSNDVMSLPGYLQDDTIPTTSLLWSLTVTSNLNGTLTQVTNGDWLYTPAPGFSGPAGFTYAVTNPAAAGLSSSARVFINVVAPNPPILGPIGSQLMQENVSATNIVFTITDTNIPVSALTVSLSGGGSLVAGYTPIIVSTNGVTNETVSLLIVPTPGQIGSANMTLEIVDPYGNAVTTNFLLTINPAPAYTIIDLGVLPGSYASYGTGINNPGQVVGYCTGNLNQSQAFYYTGFAGSQQLLTVTNSSVTSVAYAISDNGIITGAAPNAAGYLQAFSFDSYGSDVPNGTNPPIYIPPILTQLGVLGSSSSGSASTGYAVNLKQTIVGSSTTTTNGQLHAFMTGAQLTDLGLASNSVATGINNAGQIVGYIFTNGTTNAFVLTPPGGANGVVASTWYPSLLPGGGNSVANGINQSGDVVGASVMPNGFQASWILKTSVTNLAPLGLPTNMLGATANGLNSFDQVVGTAVSNGVTHAFLFSTGIMNDLNDLIPYEETNAWKLLSAQGINDSGAIVGTGLMNGSTHAFLALPAWVIGQPIAPPLGAVVQAPAVTVIGGGTITAEQAFFWNQADSHLYAIAPCTAEIQWPTALLNQANPTANTNPPIVTVSQSVWPRPAQTHVVGAPVQVVPQGLPPDQPFGYSFQSVMYSTSTSAQVDANNVFTCQTNAYSVLRYVQIQPDEPVEPDTSPNIFEVVRSVAYNDPYYWSNNVPAVIGTTITNATHFDYAGRNGYLFFQKTPYDSLDYDQASRLGPIIPVNLINRKLPVPDQDLVIVWYHTNSLGVAWADSPYDYNLQWAANFDATNTIVIASLQGSGLLPANYINPEPYVQNDPTQAGFNPNEEHALVTGGTGTAVLYALRNDLNALYKNLSLPYVLLRYQDANNNNQWTLRVFLVVATTPTIPFVYSGTAGTEIQPPLPLSVLQLCTSSNTGTAGPYYHAQVDGSIWARAAGPNGTSTNINLHYWYPLQPGFYFSNATVGACIPWLDHGTGTPVDVTYVISWPTNGYVMPVGQTLTGASGGLPDITDLLNATIIYDSYNPSGLASTTNLARLYDPYTARSLAIPPTATWTGPTGLSVNNVNGLYQFANLPYYLQLRLIYDPNNKLLSFQGVNAATGSTTSPGPPILLNNVMSIREREEIKTVLDPHSSYPDFEQLVDQLYYLTRNPNMLVLNPPGVSTNNYDTNDLLIGLTAQTNVVLVTNKILQVTIVTPSNSVSIVPQSFGSNPKALTTGIYGVPPPQPILINGTNYYPPQFVTVVQDDPAVPGSVVQMYVIQVSGGPAANGSLAVLPGNNAFDQRLTLRHTTDFGGDADPFQFQWYYQGATSGSAPTNMPILDTNGNVIDGNGWFLYSVAPVSSDAENFGANGITLGEGGESGLLIMSDNWFISRYAGYNIDGSTNWSGWIGQPGGGPEFAQGWIARVLAALNPFDARTSNFHTDPIDTYQSMLEQAGAPFQGPIALNASPAYINSIGLIQAYQTVLGIGESLSVNGTPPVNYLPADYALQQAAGQISGLDVVLGNEAYAEYSDPTIGFTTGSTFSSLASSIFAFQDQVDSLLDQELDLLRGRDDTETSVTAYPVFNRLYWNFTGGNGQVAYVSTFNITDVNGDGFINSADAQIMFPQGHGDAWGYYLSALTSYYNLLRNTNFTWENGTTAVPIDGVAVVVNFQDDAAFAHAAAAKAQTGADIVQKTYESAFISNPSGQYQGYYDTDTNRAWGLSEWARRAGQGAYFDWVTANSLIATVDPNTNDTGLNLVDRATVTDIAAIPPTAATLQNELNEADAGLNPIGLSAQSVPFDIDPTLIDQGETHFEQIYGRAVAAMVNAVSVWNQANEFTSALRQEQDTVQQFTQNVTAQDQAYQSKLISIFGYPYAGDIGQPGSTYPQGYTGPDLYHYMYVDMSVLNSAVAPPSNNIIGYYQPLPGVNAPLFIGDLPADTSLNTNELAVNYPIGNPGNFFQPPTSWGSRQAPGTVQMAAMTLMQDEIRMQQALASYNALLTQIQNNINLLQDNYGLILTNAQIQNAADGQASPLEDTAASMQSTAANLTLSANIISEVGADIVSAIPMSEGLSDDALAPLRGVINGATTAATQILNTTAEVDNNTATSDTAAAASIESQAATTIAANVQGYQMQQQVTALQNQIQGEPALRLECLSERETILQDLGAYQAAVAQGQQVLQQRCTLAQQASAQTEANRYQDMTFRIFQNDAIQKYQAQFALAKQYVYMAAVAYDFETDLLGGASGSGQQFLTSIIQQQSLGEMDGSTPVVGVAGLADPLAQMGQNFAVLKGQLGFNNPQTETGKFSLRFGLFRQQASVTNAIAINGTFTNDWQTELQNHIVPDLWQVPEFVRYCRPFAPQSAGPQPGLVIKFGTTITYGLNFFGWPLAGGDSAYDPTLFTTKVRSVGVWFDGYDNSGLSTTPRIYLIPVGKDMMRSPTDGLTVRAFRVQDQAIPVPFQLGATTEAAANYIPMNNSLSGTLNQIRQFSSFLGYTDQSPEIDPSQVTTDSRQIGRSVWNSQWILIIPGGTLLNDPNAGLQDFINTVSDIKIFFQTYSYSGD